METPALLIEKAKQLQKEYRYLLIAHLLLLIGTLLLPVEPTIEGDTALSLQSLAIFYTLGSIPGALKLFHHKLKQLDLQLPLPLLLKKYSNLFRVRYLWESSTVWGNLLIYLLSGNQSMLMLALIGAIALFFCNTSVATMANELNLSNEEDEPIAAK